MKRVVFQFDDRSKMPLDQLSDMGFTVSECNGFLFPIQLDYRRGMEPHPLWIPWAVAELA